MRSWTLAQIRAKVLNDLDLNDELFITPTEMTGYINEAIDEAQQEIHGIYEDYFLTKYPVPLAIGTASYAMPTNIFANKMRKINFDDGGTKYEVKKVRDLQFLPYVQPEDLYRFLIIHDATLGYRLTLYPPAREAQATVGSETSQMVMYYLREAKLLVNETDVCDIPEFANFILQFVKQRCYEKEGHPNTDKAMADTARQRKLMVDTLTEMVPDADNTILMDFQFYWDHL